MVRRWEWILTTAMVITIHFVGTVLSLRGVRIVMAEAVRAGSNVLLRCDYDLERAALYSIKWYRGDDEFFRYVPKEEPPARVFPVEGIRVDTAHSDSRSVSLLHVTRELSGEFRCEVSADAPLFHTDIQSAMLVVADPPVGPPYITVDKDRLFGNEILNANCSVGPAYPMLNITWFINDLPIVDNHLAQISISSLQHAFVPTPISDFFLHNQETQTIVTNRETEGKITISSLKLLTPGQWARYGKIRLACVAQLMNLYRDTAEKEVGVLTSIVGPSEPSRSIQQRSQSRVLVESNGSSRLTVSWQLFPVVLFFLKMDRAFLR